MVFRREMVGVFELLYGPFAFDVATIYWGIWNPRYDRVELEEAKRFVSILGVERLLWRLNMGEFRLITLQLVYVLLKSGYYVKLRSTPGINTTIHTCTAAP
jgi:hypothetical protein